MREARYADEEPLLTLQPINERAPLLSSLDRPPEGWEPADDGVLLSPLVLDEDDCKDVVVLRRFPLQCYRLDGLGVVTPAQQRVGKYSGNVRRRADGDEVPHGKGTFKAGTGYTWTGRWEDGLPHDPLGKEILDGLPSKIKISPHIAHLPVHPAGHLDPPRACTVHAPPLLLPRGAS